MNPGERLTHEFFDRDPVEVAPELVGTLLRVDEVVVRLTEVEAYRGAEDPGSHAFSGQTPRNAAMFGAPGHWYVYFTYGMHHCVNVVCWPSGRAGAVLLRAGEVVEGDDVVARRRPGIVPRDWARGPGRLTTALAIGPADATLPALSGRFDWRFGEPTDVSSSPRVGVSGKGGGEDYPWRFFAADDPFVSAFRRGPATSRRTRY